MLSTFGFLVLLAIFLVPEWMTLAVSVCEPCVLSLITFFSRLCCSVGNAFGVCWKLQPKFMTSVAHRDHLDTYVSGVSILAWFCCCAYPAYVDVAGAQCTREDKFMWRDQDRITVLTLGFCSFFKTSGTWSIDLWGITGVSYKHGAWRRIFLNDRRMHEAATYRLKTSSCVEKEKLQGNII